MRRRCHGSGCGSQFALGVDTMPDGAALHEDDGMVTILLAITAMATMVLPKAVVAA
jgi:hypothetical protein